MRRWQRASGRASATRRRRRPWRRAMSRSLHGDGRRCARRAGRCARRAGRAARDEPIAARDEPVAARDEPVAARDEPLAPRDEPLAARDEPVARATSADPAGRGDEPVAPRDEPTAASEEPASVSGRRDGHAARTVTLPPPRPGLSAASCRPRSGRRRAAPGIWTSAVADPCPDGQCERSARSRRMSTRELRPDRLLRRHAQRRRRAGVGQAAGHDRSCARRSRTSGTRASSTRAARSSPNTTPSAASSRGWPGWGTRGSPSTSCSAARPEKASSSWPRPSRHR